MNLFPQTLASSDDFGNLTPHSLLSVAFELFFPRQTSIPSADGYESVQSGSELSDALTGTPNSDYISGLLGNDQILAQDANDALFGGDGLDELVGGGGDDFYIGGPDSDTFVIGSGTDILHDFQPLNGDKIVITGVDNLDAVDDLTITPIGRDVSISFGDNTIATIENFTAQYHAGLLSPNISIIHEDNPLDEEVASSSILTIPGADTTFFDETAPIIVELFGDDTISDTTPLYISLNNFILTSGLFEISSDGKSVIIHASPQEGLNTLEITASDSNSDLLFLHQTFWCGSRELEVLVTNSAGAPVSGALVTAKLTEDSDIFATATSNAQGLVTFTHLPDRNITFESSTVGNLFGSVGALGGAGSANVVLKGFSEPSAVDNNDFSLGFDGWNVGSSAVTLIPHNEPSNAAALGAERSSDSIDASELATEKSASQAAGENIDLKLSTSGEGEQSISRTFTVKEGTEKVTVRFQFVTSEVPGGYFGTKYNDYYRVTVRSLQGGDIINESASMNALGRAAFDASGATAFNELTLSTNVKGDTVQVEVVVANVADDLYDSHVVVDYVDEGTLEIETLSLSDLDGSNLRYLSASANNPYFGGTSRLFGDIVIKGAEDDKLTKLELEVLDGGSVVATAKLSSAAQSALIGVAFGEDGKINYSGASPLFELSNAEASGIPVNKNSSVTLRVKAESASGEDDERKYGNVEVLGLYEGGNRYGGRDVNMGGDDWAKPSTIALLNHFSGSITVGDISNMHGGAFPPHASHQDGSHVDGHFEGYNARDAATASTMIGLLNDDDFGSKISTVFVTYSATVGNKFYDAIKTVTLDDGRKAVDVIRPLQGHTTHFHWVLSA